MKIKRLTPEQEQELLRECIKHNKCTRLVQQYYKLVFRTVQKIYIARKIPHTPEDIEDRQQDIFEKLFEKNKKRLKQYNPELGLRLDRWITLIATRTMSDHLKAKKNPLDKGDFRIPIEDSDKELGGISDDKRLDARQNLLLIAEAVENLPSPYDLVLKLGWFHGCSPKEISEILGKSVDNIYVLKSRAEKMLKKKMNKK